MVFIDIVRLGCSFLNHFIELPFSKIVLLLVQVTWSQATSPVLERNITQVVPTSLRLNTVYIEVNIYAHKSYMM